MLVQKAHLKSMLIYAFQVVFDAHFKDTFDVNYFYDVGFVSSLKFSQKPIGEQRRILK